MISGEKVNIIPSPQRNVVLIELDKPLPLDALAEMEAILNKREEMFGGANVYRILPYGMRAVNAKSIEDKAIVQCAYCKQWGALRTQCRHCGAGIS